MSRIPVLVILVGFVASLYTLEVSRVVFGNTPQEAQVYSSLQSAVRAFLGLGTTSTQTNTSFTSTASTTQNYDSLNSGTDTSFLGTEAQYARSNGFPGQNYTGTFADESGTMRQTGTGIQSTTSIVEDTTSVNTSSGATSFSNSASELVSGVITGTQPALLCVPGVVVQGEPALLFYACGDASSRAEGVGFETSGAVAGKTTVYPDSPATFEIACSEGTSAQCSVDVIKPSLAIIATPSNTVRNRTVDISWRAEEVTDCIVRSNMHSTFSRRGITGDVVSPSISQNTIFTLVCETEVGTLIRDTVQVTVR